MKSRQAPPGPFTIVMLALMLCVIAVMLAPSAHAAGRLADELKQVTAADVFPGADSIGAVEGNPPAAAAYKGSELLGYIYLNADVVDSTGYSGKPINILVGIDTKGKIISAKLMEHHEPIVLIGIPAAKMTAFIHAYVGLNYSETLTRTSDNSPADIISGATVTTMVIGDSITRSARRIAQSRGLGNAKAAPAAGAPAVIRKLNPDVNAIEDWTTLLGDGSVRRLSLSVADVNTAFAQSSNIGAAAHPEPGPDSDIFVDLYVAPASVPSIGRSLLGADGYQRLKDRLKPGQQAIIVAGSGRYSFKGSGYVRGGIFDRIELVQGDNIVRFRDRNHQRLGALAAAGAPNFPEIALFTVPETNQLDIIEPWRLALLAQRGLGAREKAFHTFDLGYSLPAKYMVTEQPPAAPVTVAAAGAATVAAAAPKDNALWMRIWRGKIMQVAILSVALLALTAIFFFQDQLVQRPVLYKRLRLGFLLFTLFWIGWYAHAQLSVVNVLTFTGALRGDFHWEYFLMDPLVFMLWSSVAVAMLFWGRGAFCGWLCPFGALQELTNMLAKRLRIPQVPVPFGVHQRLWPIKYIIFLVLFGLSLYSLSLSEQAAEVEPFKTAMILDFVRTWPFVLYALVLLFAGLFIERFFCRYLCPLGAALAIPARIRMFDWLKRYRECGNPCQRCSNECPVQAIHPEGNINPNECIQCLHCQVLYHDDHLCPVMIQKRLKRERFAALSSGTVPPASAGRSAAARTPAG
jgi:NosR/NirI family nitrous oxide reductase transcriptional regulator